MFGNFLIEPTPEEELAAAQTNGQKAQALARMGVDRKTVIKQIVQSHKPK